MSSPGVKACLKMYSCQLTESDFKHTLGAAKINTEKREEEDDEREERHDSTGQEKMVEKTAGLSLMRYFGIPGLLFLSGFGAGSGRRQEAGCEFQCVGSVWGSGGEWRITDCDSLRCIASGDKGFAFQCGESDKLTGEYLGFMEWKDKF